MDDLRKLLEEALRLPPEARAALAGRLLESLEGDVDEDAEARWSDEIARRMSDLDEGRVDTVPWTEVRRRLRSRLDGAHSG